MTPWKWNDEIKLWVNGIDDETMTAIEYDDARCKQIIQLEDKNKALRKLAYDYIQAYEKLAFDDASLTVEEPR